MFVFKKIDRVFTKNVKLQHAYCENVDGNWERYSQVWLQAAIRSSSLYQLRSNCTITYHPHHYIIEFEFELSFC